MFDVSPTKFSFGEIRHDPARPVALSCEGVSFWYGEKQALWDIDLKIHQREVTAFVGPSGCGKTTFLKCLNRMQDSIPGTRMTGRILLHGEDIHDESIDPPLLRRRFGWVAQKPNPFPGSVRENVLDGARIAGLYHTKADGEVLLEKHLRAAGLWDEMKDRLKDSGSDLSGGQQQRLCIARALATNPDVLLMDEPCSTIDPIASARVEQLIAELGQTRSVVIITHNMEQAARISQKTAYFHLGRLLEEGDTIDVLGDPKTPEARAYFSGRFG